VTGLLDVLLSPWGIAAYVLFWIFKLMCGAWVLRKLVGLLPEGAQGWIAARFGFLGLENDR
jgi:uncharacterized membrane protein